jgi:copper chaperone CopZ
MEVGDLEGVQSVEARHDTKEVTIVFGEPATEEQIVALLREINYAPASL